MAHFGVLSYKGTGHLNPLLALSRRLLSRGHKVTFFQHPDLETLVRNNGFDFQPIDAFLSAGGKRPPVKTGRNGILARISDIRYRLDRITKEMGRFLQEYPRAIRTAGVDALILGEISLAGPTVAEWLRVPYFIVSTSIPHNFGWDAPRSILSPSWLGRMERELLEVSVLRMKGPLRRNLDRYRESLGLGSVRRIDKTFPALAHITQWPQCLEIHRSKLPANFHYTGPFVDEGARSVVEFPWERLDGRPLIYASLGTTRKGDPAIFHRIADACRRLNLQLTISLGGRHDPALFASLPGDPVVVGNAPQLDLIKRASIVITHAGPNTALEALLHGKPMLALPMVLDQPAVATRLARFGAAEVLRMQDRSTEEIRAALAKIRNDSRYREAAQKLQGQIAPLRGADHAADIIAESLTPDRCSSRTSGITKDATLITY